MVWSPTQRSRLAIEKDQLEKYFRLGLTWIDPQNETKVEVLLVTNSGKEYKLRIYIPADFPNSCLILVVVQPKILVLKNGSRLPERSSEFHTLADTDGFHRICHFNPPDWTPDITLYQVFMKGRLWIEAYEAHLDTGKDMDVFLGEQKFSVTSEMQYYDTDSDYDGDDSDGFSEYLERQRQLDQPPTPMTSPFPNLSDQRLPTTVRDLQSMPELPTLLRPRLQDEASAIDLPHDSSNNAQPPTQRSLGPIDNPPSQLSQQPFIPLNHQSPQRRLSNELSHYFADPSRNNNNHNTTRDDNKTPILSSPPPNYFPPQQRNQQTLGSIVNLLVLPCVSAENSSIQHHPNDQNNETPAQISPPNSETPTHTNPPNQETPAQTNPPNQETPAQTNPPNIDTSSRPFRPQGGVLLPFHEEMIRRNSSSRSCERPTIVLPPVKPKPKRPR